MSTINVDIVNPLTGAMVTVNGLNIKKTTNTIYLGNGVNSPVSNNSVIIGDSAGVFLTGPDNVIIGKFAMLQATSTNTCVAVGAGSGASLTTGNANTFIGSTSGQSVITGFANTCVGQAAGGTLGANAITNTYIGNGTGSSLLNITGQGNTCLGNAASPSSASVNNEITLGSSSIVALRCNVTSITSLSDARDKEDVVELAAGLEFVKELNPVSFVWNDRDEVGKHGVKDFGFIAQDLKATQEKHDLAETLGLVYEENPEKLEASYGKLIPILVKAIKELSAKVEALESKKKK
jgi:hypothetical protein